MTLEPVAFRSFGAGLNLRDKEDTVSEEECIDCLNVLFTDRGSIKQRGGTDDLTAALTNAPTGNIEPFYTSTHTQILIGCGSRLEALTTAGGVVDSAAGLTASTIWDFARFGAPGAETAYAGNGTDTIRKWDGSVWSAPANMPSGGALAVMAVDQGNRLVTGRFDTATGGPGGAMTERGTVWFSDPGLPETWGANNYIHFTPGDGEQVQAIVAWGDLTFIFKESKYFVVYGTTVDASGNPIFNYRTIDTGVGCVGPMAAVAAQDGVYFTDRRGVYRTLGQAPELVSSNVDPIFLGGASTFYLGGTLNHSQISKVAMTVHEQKVYVAFPTSSVNNRVLVYDPAYEWWSLYDLPAACLTTKRLTDDRVELLFGDTSGSKKVFRHRASYTSDNGTAITSRWRSGWFDYSLTGEKTIRETKTWGTGQVFIGVQVDFLLTPGILDALAFLDPTATAGTLWGAANWGEFEWSHATAYGGLSPKLRRRAIRGTVFSTYFFNNVADQAWSVHRLTHHLREQRIPQVIGLP